MKKPTTRKQKIRRSNVRARLIIFGTLAVLLILFSIFSEYLTPYDPYFQDLSIAKSPPSAEHLLGTDRYGRDMLSRVMVGSRTSIFSTLLLVAVITTLGTAVGVFCGWRGGWLDTVLMRISDMFLAFPGIGVRAGCGGCSWRQTAKRDLLRWQRSPGPNTRALPEARRLPRRKPSG